MNEVQLLIGGRSCAAANMATFEHIDPVSGQVASRAAAATAADADRAVVAAQVAFAAWSTLGPGERRRRLLLAADLLEARAGEFVALGVAEAGGSAGWYGFNTRLAAGMLREAASMTTQVAGEVIPSDVPGNLSMALRQPCGVVLGIAPWNAPVILGVRAIAMPLACGNTVVLKASENCPALHRLIGTVMQEAGLGDGVVNVITHAPADAAAIVERLIAHPDVRRINFTGSTQVGRIVAQLAGRHLKPVLLELGGKNPMIVLEDADLDEAVRAAVFGAFFNQGQICMSTDRVIVHRRVADDFLDRFVTKTHTLKAVEPARGGSLLGAMISPQAALRVRGLVDEAVSKGARLCTGGLEVAGSLMQPAIVEGVSPDCALYREESFGPVVTVLRVDSDQDAVALANEGEYGLSASIFSRDIARAMALAGRIRSGICHINSSTVADEAQMPFGGVGGSGHGRFGGKAAINEFTELRWITVQTMARHYPI
jgi:vanillin dehydrogenase